MADNEIDTNWGNRQLLTIKELERIGGNQVTHQDNLTALGKEVAVLKVKVDVLTKVGGSLLLAVLGGVVSLIF